MPHPKRSCQNTTYRWCGKRSLNFLHAHANGDAVKSILIGRVRGDGRAGANGDAVDPVPPNPQARDLSLDSEKNAVISHPGDASVLDRDPVITGG